MIYSGKAFNRTTIKENGTGQISGFFGERFFSNELMRHKVMNAWVGCTSRHYDFVTFKDGQRYTIDLKTKERTSAIRPHHDVQIPLTQQNLKCSMYVFAVAWPREHGLFHVELQGWIPKGEFWEIAERVKKGDPHQSGRKHQADAGSLQYQQMNSMDSFWQMMGGR